MLSPIPRYWSLAYVYQLAQKDAKRPRRRYQTGTLAKPAAAAIASVRRSARRRPLSSTRRVSRKHAPVPMAAASMNDGRIVCTPKPRSAPVAAAVVNWIRRELVQAPSSRVSNHATANSVTRMLRLYSNPA